MHLTRDWEIWVLAPVPPRWFEPTCLTSQWSALTTMLMDCTEYPCSSPLLEAISMGSQDGKICRANEEDKSKSEVVCGSVMSILSCKVYVRGALLSSPCSLVGETLPLLSIHLMQQIWEESAKNYWCHTVIPYSFSSTKILGTYPLLYIYQGNYILPWTVHSSSKTFWAFQKESARWG